MTALDQLIGFPFTTKVIRAVFPSDLDGDGDEDIIIASYELCQIFWLENTTNTPTTSANSSTFNYKEIKLSPNPVSDILNIKLRSAVTNNKTKVIIYDATGRMISTHKFNEGQEGLNLDISEYPVGVYWSLIEGDINTVTSFVIMR